MANPLMTVEESKCLGSTCISTVAVSKDVHLETITESPITDTTVSGLIASGHAFFQEKNWSSATESYSSALELLVGKYGELAPECGEIYWYYGKALFEYALSQESVLGIEAVSKSSTMNQEALSETATNIVFEGEPELDDLDEAVEEEENEEGDDFAISWQILDTARIIYSSFQDTQSRMRLSEIHMILGDISMESENFNEAIQEYQASLQILTECCEPHNRRIAEIYYKLGMTYEYSNQHQLALTSVASALSVLKSRVSHLRCSEDKGKEKIEFHEELRDLETLIPDLEAKVEELKTPVDNLSDGIQQTSAVPQESVQDISCLVKKKSAAESLSTKRKIEIGSDDDIESVKESKT